MATEALAKKALLEKELQGRPLSAGGQMAAYKASESRASGDTLSFFSTSKSQAFERGSPIRRPLRDSEEDPLRALLHNQDPNQFVRGPNQFVRSPNRYVGSPDRRPRFQPSPGIDELRDETFGFQNPKPSASFKGGRRKAADVSRRSPVHRAAAEPRSANGARAHPYVGPSHRNLASPARSSVNSPAATAPVKTAANRAQSRGVASPLDLENSLFALWAHYPNPFSIFSQASTPKAAASPQVSEGQKRGTAVGGSPKLSGYPPATGWSPGSESERTLSPRTEKPMFSDTMPDHPDASEESDGAFAWHFPASGKWLGQGKPQGGVTQATPQSTQRPPLDAARKVGSLQDQATEVANRLQNELSLDKWQVEGGDRWQARKSLPPSRMEEAERQTRGEEAAASLGGDDERLLEKGGLREGVQGWGASAAGRERRKSESASVGSLSKRHSLDTSNGAPARGTSKSGPLPKAASIASLFGEDEEDDEEDVPFTFSGFFFGEPRNPRQKAAKRKPPSPPPQLPRPLGKGFGSWRPLPHGGGLKPKQSNPPEEELPSPPAPLRKSTSGSALDNDSSDGQWEEDRRREWRERRLGRRASQSPKMSRRGSGDNLAGQSNPTPPFESPGLVRQTSLSSGGGSPRKAKRSPQKGGAKSHRRRHSGSRPEAAGVNALATAEAQTLPRSEEELSAHVARHFTSPSRSQEPPPQSKKTGRRSSRASYRTDPSYRSDWQDQSDGGAGSSLLDWNQGGGAARLSEEVAPSPRKYELLESFPPIAPRSAELPRKGPSVQRQVSYPPGVYPYSLSPSPAATPYRNDYTRTSDHSDLANPTPSATPQRGYTSFSENERSRQPYHDTSEEFPRGVARKHPGGVTRPVNPGYRDTPGYCEDYPYPRGGNPGLASSRDVSEEFPRGGSGQEADVQSRASSQDFATDSSGFGRFGLRRNRSSKKILRLPSSKSFGSKVTASPSPSQQSSRAASPAALKRGFSFKSPPDNLSVVPYKKPETPESFLDSIGSGWRGFSAVRWVRSLVSQKRRRYTQNGFDLDLTYITERVIAMGFPAEGADSYIRNPMKQVQKMLESKHAGQYKVYNLCSERTYPPGKFDGRVEICPFDDHQVPPLSLMKRFCESVHAWLLGDPRHIAVVHCKAGKGRTGLMVSAYLVYTGMSAEEALAYYGERRTINGKGVTIASQRRYVFYFQHLLGQGIPPIIKTPPHVTRSLRRVRLYDKSGADKVDFVIDQLERTTGDEYWPPVQKHKGVCVVAKMGSQHPFSSSEFSVAEEARVKEHYFQMDTERDHAVYKRPPLDHYCDTPVLLTGDVRVTFFEGGSRLFYLWFNTAFVTSGLLQFGRDELDKRRGKGYGDHFAVEFVFGPVELGLTTRYGGKTGSPSPAPSDTGRPRTRWGNESPVTLDLFS